MSTDFALILKHPDLIDMWADEDIADYYTQDKPLSKYIWLNNTSSMDRDSEYFVSDYHDDLYEMLEQYTLIDDNLTERVYNILPEDWERIDVTACGVEVLPGNISRGALRWYLTKYMGWYVKAVWD